MKPVFRNWRIWVAQLYLFGGFVVIAAVAVAFFMSIGSWLAQLATLLFAFLLLMLGVSEFIGFLKERDDFIAAASHDLRTPIAALKLLIGRDDEEAQCVVERMRLMIANLDAFRKGFKAPEADRFNLVDAYREAYALFSRDYEDSVSGEVTVENDDNPVEVIADRTLTVQILWNLLGNDLKYAAPYGAVRARFSEGCFELIDEGPGMSRGERRRAFDRYYRARSVLKSGKGGFGIGLATAREAARRMGGDLAVSPNHPRGCIFTLTLGSASVEKLGSEE